MQRQITNPENLNVGIYCRLSRDDGNLGESGSIQNQKDFLTDYAIKRGFTIVNYYIDDGYSGTNFDRPGFKQMLIDAECKKINCIITKDLSRLGRNYIKSGYYLEEYFPLNNIRYIAVNDNYDTFQETTNDFGPFKNIINEWYAKDISKKVRFTIQAQQQRGESKKVPTVLYGYSQDEEGNRYPDPISSEVVRAIFNTYIETKSNGAVLKMLKDNKIVCPHYYNYLKTGFKKHIYENCSEELKYKWHKNTISNIIMNKQYLGHYMTHLSEKVSFKMKLVRRIDEPYVFLNKYEPLVTEETFVRANQILQVYKDKLKVKPSNLFQKMLYCNTCGKRLCYHEKNGSAEKGRYYCRNSKCSDHSYIPAKVINKVVAEEIHKLCNLIILNKDEFIKYAYAFTHNNDLKQKVIDSNNNEALLEKKQKIEKYIEGAIKSKIEGDFSPELFDNLIAGYKKELETINLKLAATVTVNEYIDYETEAKHYYEKLVEIANFEELTTDIISTFCESITIKNNKVNKVSVGFELKINYGKLDDCIRGFLNHE